MKRTMVVIAVAAATLQGCSNVESEDVATSGVNAQIRATADGSGSTQVRATLRVGGGTSNTFLDLSGDDVLEASYDQSAQAMSREELLGAISYVTSFPVEAEGSEFVVALLRSVDDGAPDSRATLPAPFAISAPAAESVHSRGADVSLVWSPSGAADPMTWIANGPCVQARSGVVAGDPGTLTLPAGTFVAHENQTGETCTVEVTLTRSRTGILDPGYGEGGEVRGEQVRRLQILSAP